MHKKSFTLLYRSTHLELYLDKKKRFSLATLHNREMGSTQYAFDKKILNFWDGGGRESQLWTQ